MSSKKRTRYQEPEEENGSEEKIGEKYLHLSPDNKLMLLSILGPAGLVMLYKYIRRNRKDYNSGGRVKRERHLDILGVKKGYATPDGNCLYHSIVNELKRVDNDNKYNNYNELKKSILDHIERNWDNVRKYNYMIEMLGENEKYPVKYEKNIFDDIIEKDRTTNLYGGNSHLSAASDLLNKTLIVVNNCNKTIMIIRPSSGEVGSIQTDESYDMNYENLEDVLSDVKKENPLIIHYNEFGNHYDSSETDDSSSFGLIRRRSRKKRKTMKVNTSLYDNGKGSKSGYGYKNESVAIKSVKKLRRSKRRDKMAVANTLYNRAKHHKNQTSDMRKAMRVWSAYIKELKKH